MQVHIVKLCGWRIPRRFIHQWMKSLEKELTRIFHKTSRTKAELSFSKPQKKHISKKIRSFNFKDCELTLAFLETASMRKLNRDLRKKDKVTDILSFSGSPPKDLGEMALCGQFIKKQAEIHHISSKEELGYLLIHGLLHLLGYEHEKSDKEAKIMFELQDKLFETLRKRFFNER